MGWGELEGTPLLTGCAVLDGDHITLRRLQSMASYTTQGYDHQFSYVFRPMASLTPKFAQEGVIDGYSINSSMTTFCSSHIPRSNGAIVYHHAQHSRHCSLPQFNIDINAANTGHTLVSAGLHRATLTLFSLGTSEWLCTLDLFELGLTIQANHTCWLLTTAC